MLVSDLIPGELYSFRDEIAFIDYSQNLILFIFLSSELSNKPYSRHFMHHRFFNVQNNRIEIFVRFPDETLIYGLSKVQ